MQFESPITPKKGKARKKVKRINNVTIPVSYSVLKVLRTLVIFPSLGEENQT